MLMRDLRVAGADFQYVQSIAHNESLSLCRSIEIQIVYQEKMQWFHLREWSQYSSDQNTCRPLASKFPPEVYHLWIPLEGKAWIYLFTKGIGRMTCFFFFPFDSVFSSLDGSSQCCFGDSRKADAGLTWCGATRETVCCRLVTPCTGSLFKGQTDIIQNKSLHPWSILKKKQYDNSAWRAVPLQNS